MKVLIFNSSDKAIARATDIVADALRANPRAVLGLATGGTMLPLYKALCSFEGLSFAQVTTFNLDEYIGLPPDHPASYHSYMREVLFDHVDIPLAQTHLLRGDAQDPMAEARAYEAKIDQAGGIDLQLLGIGRNGHIGFNEPTSSLGSRTRVKTLTVETRSANRPYFERDEDVPQYALTMGVQTILGARHCVLLATGANKANAVARMIEGPISAACPASALQMHPNTTIILDQDAASQLELLEYYQHVHPDGQDSAFDR